MKSLLLLLSLFLYFSHVAGDEMQTQKQGFSVEIIDESSDIPSKKIFINFETIKLKKTYSAKTKGTKGKPDRTWLGTNLSVLLEEQLNIKNEDIKKLSVSAPDGYTSVLSAELLSALKTAICAYKIDTENIWPGKYGYVRLIFPELRAMYWVNGPVKMEITLGKNKTDKSSYNFYFLDGSNFQMLKKSDLKKNPYFAVEDILFELDSRKNNFHIFTQDGLLREYMPNDIYRRLLLKQEKTGTWKITGVDVPLGLKTRQIYYFKSKNSGLFLKFLSEEEEMQWIKQIWEPFKKNISFRSDLNISVIYQNGDKKPVNYPNGNSSIYKTIEKIYKNNTKVVDHIEIHW